MESNITGTVDSVTGRTTKTGPIYDVVVGGTTLSTFKADIAEMANVMRGSSVEATYYEKPSTNPNYPPNKVLTGVKLVDAVPTTNGSSIKIVNDAIDKVAVEPSKKGWTNEDTARVTRLSCLSTAFNYYGLQQEVGGEEAAIELARRLYDIAMGKQHKQEEPQQEATVTPINDGIVW